MDTFRERQRQQAEDAKLRNRVMRCTECGAKRMARPVTGCERHPGADAVVWGQPEAIAWRYLSFAGIHRREDVHRFVGEFEANPHYWKGVLADDLYRVGELFLRWDGVLPEMGRQRADQVSPKGLFG